jgi:hypothetical protein
MSPCTGSVEAIALRPKGWWAGLWAEWQAGQIATLPAALFPWSAKQGILEQELSRAAGLDGEASAKNRKLPFGGMP